LAGRHESSILREVVMSTQFRSVLATGHLC
jgi:hypothetical protein